MIEENVSSMKPNMYFQGHNPGAVHSLIHWGGGGGGELCGITGTCILSKGDGGCQSQDRSSPSLIKNNNKKRKRVLHKNFHRKCLFLHREGCTDVSRETSVRQCLHQRILAKAKGGVWGGWEGGSKGGWGGGAFGRVLILFCCHCFVFVLFV